MLPPVALDPTVLGAVSVFAALAHGTWHRNSPVFGPVLHRLPGPGKNVALTFDDGPNAAATPAILDALRAANVPATFFLLGKAVERFPELARRIAAEGHQLGNHGYAHMKLHRRSPRQVRADLRQGAEAITRACGRPPRFFRAPHGFRSPWVASAARALGERTVGWSLGVWDSSQPGADVIADRVRRGVRPGSIVLLHDGDGYDLHGDRRQTAAALPEILRRLQADGYAIVPLPED